MKRELKHIIKAIACVAFMSSCNLGLQDQSEFVEPNVEMVQGSLNFAPANQIDTGSYGGNGIAGKYYYPNNQTNLPLVVIAHADWPNGSGWYKNYDILATSLAEQGAFVVSIARSGASNNEGVLQMYETLQNNLKHIYSNWNGEVLNDGQAILNENQAPLIAHDIMLIGHSAGGRELIHKGKSAVNNLGLQLKAMVGLAPTMGSVPGIEYDIHNVPFFIIQGNSDTDLSCSRHYGKGLNGPQDWMKAKVPVFENEKLFIHGGVERAYILLNEGNHWIQNSSKVYNYCIDILSAFLKGDRSSFDNRIRYQIDKIYNSNILYWNKDDALYFEANSGILPAGSKFATIFSDGITYTKSPSNHLLGTSQETKSLHFSNVLQVRLGLGAVKGNRLKFMLSEPATDANYVRFHAGEIFDFSTEDYSTVGINPRIRLIYSGNFKSPVTSDWMHMQSYLLGVNGLNCGKIQNAQIHPDPSNCNTKRNIMQTYVIGLHEFTGGPAGADVIGIEFDFTNTLGNKRFVLDDLAFMN